jgi:predicted ABC-type ATPase
MDYSKPILLIISGPNGAGKSTHIESMLPASFEGLLSFDRDLTRTSIKKIGEGWPILRANKKLFNRLYTIYPFQC